MVKALGPLGYDIELWVAVDPNTWEFEYRNVVVDGPGVWSSTVEAWVRSRAFIAQRFLIPAGGGANVPVETLDVQSGRLYRTRYDPATGTWLPRELVVGEVER